MRIDLHTHSTASDGTDTPAELVANAAAAGLAYNFLNLSGQRPGIGELARQFGCPARQLVFCARRIAGCLDKDSRTQDK